MSYILSSAECDLNLNLIDKGNLNAITYGGEYYFVHTFLLTFLTNFLLFVKYLLQYVEKNTSFE